MRAEILLNRHRAFRRQAVTAAVNVAAKRYAFIVNPVNLGEAEHLEAARIGEHRAGPLHEPVQAAHLAHQFIVRAQVQMIGVRQHQRRAGFGQITRGDGLDRRLRADGGEDGRRDVAVRGRNDASTCFPVRFDNVKIECHSCHALQANEL